jgi:hypothetical protein
VGFLVSNTGEIREPLSACGDNRMFADGRQHVPFATAAGWPPGPSPLPPMCVSEEVQFSTGGRIELCETFRAPNGQPGLAAVPFQRRRLLESHVPYGYSQLLSWYEAMQSDAPPAGTKSLGVDRARGVIHLVLAPEHDAAAVQELLSRLPSDAAIVEVSTARWVGDGQDATKLASAEREEPDSQGEL